MLHIVDEITELSKYDLLGEWLLIPLIDVVGLLGRQDCNSRQLSATTHGWPWIRQETHRP